MIKSKKDFERISSEEKRHDYTPWLAFMLATGYYYTYGSEGYRGDPKAGKDERTYKGKKDEI